MGEELIERLGPDLRRLIEGAGAPLLHAEEITPARSGRSPRGAFRLEFADNRVMKGRRFQSAERAAAAWRLLSSMPAGFFPRTVAHGGDALLEEWVAGTHLTPASADPASLRQVGQMLASLHLHSVEPLLHAGAVFDASALLARLADELDTLVLATLLDRGSTESLYSVAQRAAPGSARVGLRIGDTSPANLLRLAGDRLVWVDTGSVSLGLVDEDLARLWLHWALPEGGRTAVLEGYRELRSPEAFFAALPFWSTVVLVHSARIALERHTGEGVAVARAALDRLTCELEPPDLARHGAVETRPLDVHGLRIVVHGSSRAPVEWLREFFGAPQPAEIAAATRIELQIDPARYEGMLDAGAPHAAETRPCFTLDGGERTLILRRANGSGHLLHDAGAASFIEVERSGRHIRVVARDDRRQLRALLMRIVRELATLHALASGWQLVHAAAVAYDGRALAFAGRARSGKTTVLLHALMQSGVGFLSNDRILLRCGSDDRPVLQGSPTIVRVRPGSFDFLDAPSRATWGRNRPYFRAPGEGALPTAGALDAGAPRELPSISPAELARWCGVEWAREAPLALLVFLTFDAEVERFTLRPLTPAEAEPRLTDAQRFGSDSRHPGRRTAHAWLREPPPAHPPAAATTSWLAANCTLVECRLGPGAFRNDALWTALLEAARGGASRR